MRTLVILCLLAFPASTQAESTNFDALAQADGLGATSPPPTAVSSSTAWMEQPADATEFSRRVELIRTTTYSDGSTRAEVVSPGYTALGSGLNYRDEAGNWQPSSIEPELAQDGAVSFTRLPTKYRFAHNANLQIVVESAGPDAPSVGSAVAGLSYYDRISGKSVVFAQVQDSKAEAFDDGVFYPNAFEGADADIVYRVRSWGLEQDVVLYGNLPEPSVYGLDPKETVLCVLTELTDLDLAEAGVEREGDIKPEDPDPAPLQVFRKEADSWQRVHNWQRCYAYAEKDGSYTLAGIGTEQGENHPVSMRLFSAEGRTFLSEEIPAAAILSANPVLFAGDSHGRTLAGSELPRTRPAKARLARRLRRASPKKLAAYPARWPRRYVIDYVDYSGAISNAVTFWSGNTYYIKSEFVLEGTNAVLTVQPGCYVKFTNTASIKLTSGAGIDTRCNALSNAFFTAACDTNGGEVVYSGNPASNKYRAALIFDNGASNSVQGLQIRYAQTGLVFKSSSGAQALRDSRFLSCNRAVEFNAAAPTSSVFNCHVKDGADGVLVQTNSLVVQAVSFDNMTNWALCATGNVYSLTVRDTLFAAASSILSSWGLAASNFFNNGIYPNTNQWIGSNAVLLAAYPFTNGLQGSAYLVQSCPLVNSGSVAASAIGLYHFTTATNHAAETNSTVDVGFHYAALGDWDSDGIQDVREDLNGDGVYDDATDLCSWTNSDTDGDTLSDGEEVNVYGSDPEDQDTDGDGQQDYAEVQSGSSPLLTNSFLTTISGVVSNATPLGRPVYVRARALPPTNGLVLYYSFATNGGSQVTDLSGLGHTGQVVGATYVTNGPGGWYRFDGVDDYIRVTNTAAISTPSFSVSVWAQTFEERATAPRSVFGKARESLNQHMYLTAEEVNDDSFQGRLYGTSYDPKRLCASTKPMTYTWTHLAVTYNGSSWCMYTNGCLAGSTNLTGYAGNSLDMLFGAGAFHYYGPVYIFWKGLVDEAAMYNRALSAAEVSNLFGMGVNAYVDRIVTADVSGAYALADLPNLRGYALTAWEDINTNGVKDSWEPAGSYDSNPLDLASASEGVNIVLTSPDSDRDGMPDWWELQYGLNPNPLTNTLVGWWPLDETNGTTILDISGNNRNGTLLNTNGGERVPGVMSNALWFYQGSNMWVDLGFSSALNVTGNQVTVTCWYRPNIYDGSYNQAAVSKIDYDVNYSLWLGWGNTPRFEVKVNATNYTALDGGFRATETSWCHLTGVYDGTAVRFYANGIQKGIVTNVSGNLTPNSQRLRFAHSVGTYNLRGRLDDVRIYRSALVSNDIARLMEPMADTDSDGLTDLQEYQAGSCPTNSDTDGDAMPDSWEVTYNLNPLTNDAAQDADGDGLSNLAECQLGCDPTSTDSDLDGMPDGWEVTYGFSPGSPGLTCWYKLDEANGVLVTDSSSNALNGFVTNAPAPLWTTGHIGGALELDGTNDGITVPYSPLLSIRSKITISGWVYQHTTNGIQTLAEKNGAYYLNLSGGRPQFYWYGITPPGYHTAPQAIPTCTWTHVAATYNGTTVVIYVGGTAVLTTNATGAGNTSSANLGIGWNGYSAVRYLDGMLDDVRIYAAALSSNAIYSMYDSLQDADADGLSNLQEYLGKTDPLNADTNPPTVVISFPTNGYERVWLP